MSEKLKIYLETSVISMYFQDDAPYLKELTILFWNKILPDYERWISDISFDELMAVKSPQLKRNLIKLIKDIKVLERSPKIDEITDSYLSYLKIPRADAMHLAYASLGNMDILVTWNLRHLYKPSTQEVVRNTNLRLRLSVPMIVTPENFFD